ncbi:MAG: haloalkane dehalogenase [Pseudomonadota bacterium]
MTVSALRTPEERFSLLPAFPYEPQYIDDLSGYEELQMAWYSAGPENAESVFLCLHGEPTWSYLFRKMIPVFADAGHRVVAPDLFGFGRSDKPIDDAVYTFNFHRDALVRFIERLDLRNITLVCQDWGGILGLTLPMDMPERFSQLLVMNTAIPVGEAVSEGFQRWKGFAARAPEIPVGGMLAADAMGQVNLMDALAYDAPFPDNSYKAGVRRFPQLVPIAPEMEGADTGQRARAYFAEEWEGKCFMAIGMRDPVLGDPAMRQLQAQIRNCNEPMRVDNAGHFVQEYGKEIAEAALVYFSQ